MKENSPQAYHVHKEHESAEAIREALNFGPLPLSERGRNILDAGFDSLDYLIARLREAENKFEIMCEENADNLASLEAAERERDHWIVETKKADRRLEGAERERDALQHVVDCADTPLMRGVLAAREAAEAENERLLLNINGIAAQLRREGYTGLADRLAALAARTEEGA